MCCNCIIICDWRSGTWMQPSVAHNSKTQAMVSSLTLPFRHVVTIATNHTSRLSSQRCSQVTTRMLLTSEELPMKAPIPSVLECAPEKATLLDYHAKGKKTLPKDRLSAERVMHVHGALCTSTAHYARPRRIALHLF